MQVFMKMSVQGVSRGLSLAEDGNYCDQFDLTLIAKRIFTLSHFIQLDKTVVFATLKLL